jgi:hypothetical protein
MSNTNTSEPSCNGKGQKKTLADQLDRLDGIIDALANGLNETVAEVVKQAVSVAVQQAVEGLVQAVLTNPELLRGLIAKVVPTASEPKPEEPSEPAKPSRLARACSWVRSCCAAFQQKLGKGLKAVRRRLWMARRFKVQLLTAMAVGAVAGAGAYFVGPWLAAGVSAAAGFATTLAVQAGLWFRRVLSRTVPVQP